MSLEKKISEIIDEFSFFESWEEKYEYLIDLGRSLKTLNKDCKTDLNLVRGCQANVWLICKIKNDKLILQGDSDAIITRGLVGLLIAVFNNCPAQEVARSNHSFLENNLANLEETTLSIALVTIDILDTISVAIAKIPTSLGKRSKPRIIISALDKNISPKETKINGNNTFFHSV